MDYTDVRNTELLLKGILSDVTCVYSKNYFLECFRTITFLRFDQGNLFPAFHGILSHWCKIQEVGTASSLLFFFISWWGGMPVKLGQQTDDFFVPLSSHALSYIFAHFFLHVLLNLRKNRDCLIIYSVSRKQLLKLLVPNLALLHFRCICQKNKED